MKQIASYSRTAAVVLAAVLLALVAPGSAAAEINDDFSTTDSAWERIDPFASFGVVSTYEIKDGKYVLTTQPSPELGMGPVTASVRQPVNWTNFLARADVSGWTRGGDSNTVAGVFGRTSVVGPGALNGYIAVIQPSWAETVPNVIDARPLFALYVLWGSYPTLMSAADIPELDPADSYTIELSGNGPNLQARLYRAGESEPLRTLRGVNRDHTSGSVGFSVVYREPLARQQANRGVSASFDNFHAEDSAAPDISPIVPAPTPVVSYVITDDFSSGTDTGWVHVDPLQNATYSFDNGRYTLSAPASPAPQISPAFVGAIRPVDWTDFQVSVDFTGWLSGTNASQYILVNGRQRNHTDGTSDFYGLRVVHGPNPHVGTAQAAVAVIERYEHNVPVALIGAIVLGQPLHPSRTFRAVFAGRGPTLQAWILQVGATETRLLGYLGCFDDTIPSGAVGVLVIDRFGFVGVGQRAISAQFDNFKAWGTDSISEDFSGGLPETFGQTHPFALLGVSGSVVSADGVVTVSHPPSPAPQVAPALLSLTRSANWQDAEVSVDFTGWSTGPKTNITIALSLRMNPGANGIGDGYTFAIQPSATPELQTTTYESTAGISFEHVVGGASIYGSLAGREMPPLDPTKWYRGVFRITSNPTNDIANLRGEVYEVGKAEPHATLYARIHQPAFHSGGVSLAVVDRAALARIANNGFTVKFDNFRASGVTVPAATAPAIDIASAIMLNWPRATAGWRLEAAQNPDGPWSGLIASPQLVGGENQVTIRSSEAHQFYRLRKP